MARLDLLPKGNTSDCSVGWVQDLPKVRGRRIDSDCAWSKFLEQIQSVRLRPFAIGCST